MRSFSGFSACRDTQHHASDDKREGGLHVGAVERHHCDTVRRVWESNPYQQVRTSPDTYEFVACACSLVNFGTDSSVCAACEISPPSAPSCRHDDDWSSRFREIRSRDAVKIYRSESNRFARNELSIPLSSEKVVSPIFFCFLFFSLLFFFLSLPLFGEVVERGSIVASRRLSSRHTFHSTLFHSSWLRGRIFSVGFYRKNEPAARNELSIPLSSENAVSPSQSPCNSLFPQSETSPLPLPSGLLLSTSMAKSVSRPSKRKKGKKAKTVSAVSKKKANRKCIGRAVSVGH